MPFFLQIFETNFITRIKEDKYNIKDFIQTNGRAQSMLEKYNIKDDMTLKDAITSCEVLELCRVSPESVKSRHVIICVHGFLM